MPSFEVNYRSRWIGPFHSHQINRDAHDYSEDVAEALADEAKDQVLDVLAKNIRVRTPYYETRIDTRDIGEHRFEVHDHGVVYGHWLEGDGSRNRPRPGFPGYHAFEIAERIVATKRQNIARKILRRYRASGRLT